MKTSYDPEADALFVRFSASPVAGSEEVSPDIVVDFDKDGHVVGIEILNAKIRLGEGFSPADLIAA